MDDDWDDWTRIIVEVPPEDGAILLKLLKERLRFTEIDYCEMLRHDLARVSYGPCPPRTTGSYTLEPFPTKEA
jgi:hypothetical protein